MILLLQYSCLLVQNNLIKFMLTDYELHTSMLVSNHKGAFV